MNILYKYVDTNGIIRILEDLELKLPYVSDVNDPYECYPYFHFPSESSLEAHFLHLLNGRILRPKEYRQRLAEHHQLLKKFNDELSKDLKTINEESCLLSVSETAQNTVMWAHYTELHKGAVIGIDFDTIISDSSEPSGLSMDSVMYSENRPMIDILKWFDKGISRDEILAFTITKSDSWDYEKEHRAAFPKEATEKMQQDEIACLKDFCGKDTWFLKLNSASIREVVFGLDTDGGLKAEIRKLIKEQKHLQHIQLKQAEESETYDFKIYDISKSLS